MEESLKIGGIYNIQLIDGSNYYLILMDYVDSNCLILDVSVFIDKNINTNSQIIAEINKMLHKNESYLKNLPACYDLNWFIRNLSGYLGQIPDGMLDKLQRISNISLDFMK